MGKRFLLLNSGAAGGKSPSLYGEGPKIAKDSCRSLKKKGSEPALLFLVIWSPSV